MGEPLFFQAARTVDGQELGIVARMANRHGLIAGATGTGKTVTLRVLAEEFSRAGVPVFLADVKGDLSGMACAGEKSGIVAQRMEQFGLPETRLSACPVRFWDLFGEMGIPIRATISDMGPMLLARLMNLNPTQEGLINIVFRVADDNGWLLIDLKDLRAMLQHIGSHATEYRLKYGNISAASIGAVQRQLLVLENEGAADFFGEPALNLEDLMQTEDGAGVVNILNAARLMRSPKVYGAFLLWLLAQLFQTLPETGDPEKPKFVFFFDEAHLLFDNAPAALIEQIEQVVRLIRSKGVGVYFVTQNPLDLPDSVLGQLGNRIQHALRAFTPRDQKAVRAAAETFRANPNIHVAETIGNLGVGEALVSFLDEKGMPTPVERAQILPPRTQLPPLSDVECQNLVRQDFLLSGYLNAVDNFSAYEALAQQPQNAAGTTTPTAPSSTDNHGGLLGGFLGGLSGARKERDAGMAETLAHQIGRSVNSTITRSIGRAITRSILGAVMGGRRR